MGAAGFSHAERNSNALAKVLVCKRRAVSDHLPPMSVGRLITEREWNIRLWRQWRWVVVARTVVDCLSVCLSVCHVELVVQLTNCRSNNVDRQRERHRGVTPFNPGWAELAAHCPASLSERLTLSGHHSSWPPRFMERFTCTCKIRYSDAISMCTLCNG